MLNLHNDIISILESAGEIALSHFNTWIDVALKDNNFTLNSNS